MCVFLKTHDKEKKIAPPLGANGSPSVSRGGLTFGKKLFGVRCNKTHGGFAVRYKKTTQTLEFAVLPNKKAWQIIFYRVFSLCRAPYIKRAAKKLFVVCLKENARQRFSRTAKLGFPVVKIKYFYTKKAIQICKIVGALTIYNHFEYSSILCTTRMHITKQHFGHS
jgi:hypothetical protein